MLCVCVYLWVCVWGVCLHVCMCVLFSSQEAHNIKVRIFNTLCRKEQSSLIYRLSLIGIVLVVKRTHTHTHTHTHTRTHSLHVRVFIDKNKLKNKSMYSHNIPTRTFYMYLFIYIYYKTNCTPNVTVVHDDI